MPMTLLRSPDPAEKLQLRSVARAEMNGPPDEYLAMKVIGVGDVGADILDVLVASEQIQGNVEFAHALTSPQCLPQEPASPGGEAQIVETFSDTALVVIVCGQEVTDGRVAEAIAQAARTTGALTIVMIVAPQTSRAGTMNASLRLAGCTDALIPLPHLPPEVPVRKAVAEYLVPIIAALSSAFSPMAPVCLDFEDVRSILGQCGRARLGFGQSSDQDRAVKAATQAMDDIGVEHLTRASGVLVLISGGRKMRLREFAKAMHTVRAETAAGATLALGVGYDDQADDVMKIMLIAANSYN
ncbi:FtsZ/tubulin family protein [Paraburkholderia rhynchosiae]|nr:hypothetical protein [Paraburkholderia rhynchosiae]CAB3661119.1 Cell division protein FtsZ [Paraburkholderia rhynchosiae]